MGSSTGLPRQGAPSWQRDELLAAWEASSQRCLTYDQMRRRLASDESAEACWNLVAALRKRAGYVMPYKLYLPEGAAPGADGAGPCLDVFIYLSKELFRLQGRLLRRSGPGTGLAERLGRWRSSRPVIATLVADQVIGALRRDGVEADPSRARLVLLGAALPASDEEQLLCRAFNLFRDPSPVMRDRFTRGSVELIGESLAEGLAIGESLRSVSRLDGLEGYPRFEADDVLAAVCRLMNRDDRDLLPLVAIHDAPALLWDLAPLPRLNFAVALIVRRICCDLFGYPAMAYTAYIEDYCRWAEGEEVFGGVLPSIDAALDSRMSAEGFDATFYQEVLTEIDVLGVRRLERAVSRLEGMRASLARELEGDARLNARQRAFLASLIERGQPALTVGDYAASNQVSYTTARHDLAALADMGFLACSYSSGAGRYSAGETFDSLVARALQEAQG